MIIVSETGEKLVFEVRADIVPFHIANFGRHVAYFFAVIKVIYFVLVLHKDERGIRRVEPINFRVHL